MGATSPGNVGEVKSRRLEDDAEGLLGACCDDEVWEEIERDGVGYF